MLGDVDFYEDCRFIHTIHLLMNSPFEPGVRLRFPLPNDIDSKFLQSVNFRDAVAIDDGQVIGVFDDHGNYYGTPTWSAFERKEMFVL